MCPSCERSNKIYGHLHSHNWEIDICGLSLHCGPSCGSEGCWTSLFWMDKLGVHLKGLSSEWSESPTNVNFPIVTMQVPVNLIWPFTWGHIPVNDPHHCLLCQKNFPKDRPCTAHADTHRGEAFQVCPLWIFWCQELCPLYDIWGLTLENDLTNAHTGLWLLCQESGRLKDHEVTHTRQRKFWCPKGDYQMSSVWLCGEDEGEFAKSPEDSFWREALSLWPMQLQM